MHEFVQVAGMFGLKAPKNSAVGGHDSMTSFCLRTENRARETRIFDDRGGVGWGGVGQDVTVMWTSAHLWCYATEIFSRLSYIFDATLVRSSLDFHRSLMLRWGGVGWGGVGQDVTVMWTSAHFWCYATEIFSRLSYIFDATLVRSSLDFHRSLMLRWGGVGWGKMLPSCEHLHIFDATLVGSSLDFP